MSTPDQPQGTGESRSSVSLVVNAKGETQVTIKAYVGDSLTDLMDARDRALRTLKGIATELATTAHPMPGTKRGTA